MIATKPDRRLIPRQAIEAFYRDLMLVLGHVVENKDNVYEEDPTGEDAHPYDAVIRATWFDSDDCVAAIDDLTDWCLWVTDKGNPADWPVRAAATRLRAALPG